jgi:ABC-type transporter Mla maintaining outer membrane lipid asymmetry ATPase subunit MlaF
LIGLDEPAQGEIFYGGESFTRANPVKRQEMLRRTGVLFQSGALWSSMTLAENVALALAEYSDLNAAEIREIAALKLALVGLKGFEDYYPAEISGGMQKRAGLARAMALDPERGIGGAESLDPNTVEEMIDQGLRGGLQTESLLTGVLYVGLDFFPGTPSNLVQQPDGHYKYPEIPDRSY